jgi:hypothetical protein
MACAHLPKENSIPGVTKLEFINPPLVGTTKAHQEIHLGGFAGLKYLGRNQDGNFEFVTVTTRGPVGDMYNGNRPFALPEFTPQIIFFSVNSTLTKVDITKTLDLKIKNKNATGVSYKPNPEDPVDVFDYLIDDDPNGVNPGAITSIGNSYFIAEEYAPSLLEVDSTGEITKKYSDLTKARFNRGFTGIASFKDQLWVSLESPLQPGPGDMKVPVTLFDLTKRKKAGTRFYKIDDPSQDRIGDIANFINQGLLFLEGQKIYLASEDAKADILKKKFILDLSKVDKKTDTEFSGIDVVEGKYLVVITNNNFGLRGRPDYLKSGLIPTKAEESFIYFIDGNLLAPEAFQSHPDSQ